MDPSQGDITSQGGWLAVAFMLVRSAEAIVGRFMFNQRASVTMEQIHAVMTQLATSMSSLSNSLTEQSKMTQSLREMMMIFIAESKARNDRGGNV